MVLNVRNITTKVKQAITGISSLLDNIRNAADAAQTQIEQLRNSPLDALPGKNKLGIDVLFVSDEGYSAQGDVTRRFSIGVLGDQLDGIGSLRKEPQNSTADSFYKNSRNGANMNRTVTAVTTDALLSTVPSVVARDPDFTFNTEEVDTKSRSLAERVFDGITDGASAVPYLNNTTAQINETTNAVQARIKSEKITSASILENITNTTDLVDNIGIDDKSDVFGLSSVEIVEMKNIKPRTILKTYEEMESILRACNREVTEVVVHHTDTYEDQNINYDDVYKWHVEDRGFKDVGYHFLILRNGDLQVARPISQTGAHCLKGHNRYSIGIAFVGGIVGSGKKRGSQRSSSTFRPEQWETFKAFMRAFYSVHPGGQAFGHVDIDPERRSDPNFDVQRYVKKSFGKENIQTNEETQGTGALSIDDMIGLQ